jgi:hypothetical protein
MSVRDPGPSFYLLDSKNSRFPEISLMKKGLVSRYSSKPVTRSPPCRS